MLASMALAQSFHSFWRKLGGATTGDVSLRQPEVVVPGSQQVFLIDMLVGSAQKQSRQPDISRVPAKPGALAEESPADVIAVIDFAATGNSGAYQIKGWSHQEDGFVWATGVRSEIYWPEPGGCRSVTLELDVFPCILLPYRHVQRLFLRSERGLLARVDITREGPVSVYLPDELMAAGLDKISLYHPDFIIPAEATDSCDGRELSIAFRRITMRGVRIERAAPVLPKYQPDRLALSDKELISRFEGLGGTAQGCEFGLLQRTLGAEPLGLLRWTQMNAESLADALENAFDGVGTPEQTILDYFQWPTYQEYRTEDRRFLMSMHTWVKKEDKPFDEMYKMICQWLKFLKRKLIADLTEAEKIFVFKMGDQVCSLDQVRRIHRAMRQFGPNTLLYVRTSDPAHPPGLVEQVENGLLIGYITQFNQAPDGQARPIALESWLSVCREAHRLWARSRPTVS